MGARGTAGMEKHTSLEWSFSAAVVATGSTLFGHFGEGTPKWLRLSRWAAYLGVVGLLSGRSGALLAQGTLPVGEHLEGWLLA
jgi:hypothetical protein